MCRFVFAAALLYVAPACAETMYFSAIPDLPVAAGLTETAHQFASFAEAGSADLVLATAHGSASPGSVQRFYNESLSALGWSLEPAPRGEEMTFFRGRERLVLRIEPSDGGTYLSVRLVVRPASMNAD